MRENIRKMKNNKKEFERDADDKGRKKVQIEGQLKQVVGSCFCFYNFLIMFYIFCIFLCIVKVGIQD